MVFWVSTLAQIANQEPLEWESLKKKKKEFVVRG
jgi:hypothetical protein